MTAIRAAALLLVLMMLAAACAADDDSGEDSAAVEPTEEAMDDEAMDDEAMDDEAMDDEAMEDMDAEGSEMAMDEMDMEEGEHDGHDMEGMDMGDPDATPADELTDAQLSSGDFTVLDSAPEGYDGSSGQAFLATNEDGTTATLYASGLPADTEHVAHIHAQSCDDENGGPHFKFDPDGSDVPPNEIHLNFTSDADGEGMMTATNEMVVDDGARSLVIHPADLPDNRALCADFG